jgi:hypothetical protein
MSTPFARAVGAPALYLRSRLAFAIPLALALQHDLALELSQALPMAQLQLFQGLAVTYLACQLLQRYCEDVAKF